MRGVADSSSQRIGCMVGLGNLVELENLLDHVLNLLLISRTGTDNGKLDLPGGELPYIDSFAGARDKGSSASLARGKRTSNVIAEPNGFDADADRSETIDDSPHLVADFS